MRIYKEITKPWVMSILAIIMICFISIYNCQSVLAQEKTEDVAGSVYEWEEKGNYEISSSKKPSSTNNGLKSNGKFCITGNINSISEKNGFPAYSVTKSTLAFSYTFKDTFLKAAEDEEHLVDDNNSQVNGIALDSDIKKGALIVQTSKDGKKWFTISGAAYTNIFEDFSDGLKKFYITTNLQMVNGCYYRVIVAYKTAIRTQTGRVFPPRFEKYTYKKYLEIYDFYAYDESAFEVAVPESKNRCNLGSKVRTEKEGYTGSVAMDNDDPHFGWDVG